MVAYLGSSGEVDEKHERPTDFNPWAKSKAAFSPPQKLQFQSPRAGFALKFGDKSPSIAPTPLMSSLTQVCLLPRALQQHNN